MTRPKVTASSGSIFPGIIVIPVILGGGTAVVLALVEAARYPILSAIVSYLGCCLMAFVPVSVATAWVAVVKGWGEREEPHWLVWATPAVLAALIGAGLYYLIHHVIAIPSLVFASKYSGSLLICGVGWGLWAHVQERPAR